MPGCQPGCLVSDETLSGHPHSRPVQRSGLGGSPVRLDGALLGHHGAPFWNVRKRAALHMCLVKLNSRGKSVCFSAKKMDPHRPADMTNALLLDGTSRASVRPAVLFAASLSLMGGSLAAAASPWWRPGPQGSRLRSPRGRKAAASAFCVVTSSRLATSCSLLLPDGRQPRGCRLSLVAASRKAAASVFPSLLTRHLPVPGHRRPRRRPTRTLRCASA